MDLLLPLILASLVSAEELRFSAALEQSSESSCGPAAAASLLSLYCGIPLTEAELPAALPPRQGGASLGELLALLGAAGLRARAFRLDLPALDLAVDRDYAPVLLHYDRPQGHFALLLGREGPVYVLADPERGLESLAASELEARWSGAALLLDPACFTEEGRSLRAEALSAALGRRELLVETSAAQTQEPGGEALPGGSPKEGERERLGFRGAGAELLRLGLDLEFEALGEGLALECGLDLELRFAFGLSLGLGLPLSLGLATLPSYLLPGDLSLRLGLSRCRGPWLFGSCLGLSLPSALGLEEGLLYPAGGFGLGLELEAARILDPASLAASLALELEYPGAGASAPQEPRFSLALGLSSTVALNERVYLASWASLGLGWSSARAGFEAALDCGALAGIRLGAFGASLGGSGSRSYEGGQRLRLGISWESEGDR